MPAGDWGQGTKLRPIVINVTVDEGGQIDHVGIGYRIVTPSGREHNGGFTWHSPKGGYASAPAEHIDGLQRIVTALLRAAAEHEGIEPLAPGPEHPQVERIPLPPEKNGP